MIYQKNEEEEPARKKPNTTWPFKGNRPFGNGSREERGVFTFASDRQNRLEGKQKMEQPNEREKKKKGKLQRRE